MYNGKERQERERVCERETDRERPMGICIHTHIHMHTHSHTHTPIPALMVPASAFTCFSFPLFGRSAAAAAWNAHSMMAAHARNTPVGLDRPCIERAAIWNCVYYNVHTYQQSILGQMGTLIASAHAQANLHGRTISPQEIVNHLKSAIKVWIYCVLWCATRVAWKSSMGSEWSRLCWDVRYIKLGVSFLPRLCGWAGFC